MKLLANYHTHTALCGHAAGMSADYAKEAIAKGLIELGFSDHGPVPRPFMTDKEYRDNWLERQMDEDAFENVYLPDLENSIRTFGDRIRIRTGLEIEYLPGHDDYYRRLLAKVEYLSLGIHYFPSENGLFNTYDAMTPARVREYADLAERALDAGFFTILNHPDLYLMSYRDAAGRLVFDDVARTAAERIVEAAIRNGVYLEINGGGPRRGLHPTADVPDWLYPRTAFWRVVENYPAARVVIGCDTHNPPELYDATIEAVIAFAGRFRFKLTSQIDSLSERSTRP